MLKDLLPKNYPDKCGYCFYCAIISKLTLLL